MAFRDIAEQIKYPDGTSERYKRLDALERLLDGKLYEHLRFPFNVELDSSEDYIPQSQRRPAVIYNLAKIIVAMTASLTFGKNHAPHIQCADPSGDRNEPAEKLLRQLIDDGSVWQKMLLAVFRGAVGSCALVVRALPDGQPWISVVRGKEAQPLFNPRDPRELLGMIQQFPLSGADLVQLGYTDVDEAQQYWLRIELDESAERWFLPLANDEFQKLRLKDKRRRTRWVVDEARSLEHGFGVCPAIWCRNLEETERIDGPATFGDIVDACVDIDYKLSQISRGLSFAIDPLVVVKRGELSSLTNELGGSTRVVKNGGAPLVLGSGDDAKLLEATGKGFSTAIEYVKLVREWALEVVGGMKSDQEHSGGVQSGRALEMLFQVLDWLIDRMRSSFGDDGLVPLLRLLLIGVRKGVLVPSVPLPALADSVVSIQQMWPEKKIPRGAELAQTVNALQGLAGGSIKSPKQLLPDDMTTELAALAVGASDPGQIAQEMQSVRAANERKEQAAAAVAAAAAVEPDGSKGEEAS